MQTSPPITSATAPVPVRGSGPPGLPVGTRNVLILPGPDVVGTPPTVVVARWPAVVTDDGTVDVVAPSTVVFDDGTDELVEAEGAVVDDTGDEVLDDGPVVVLGEGLVVGGTVVPVDTVVVAVGEGPGNAQRLLKTAMPSSVQFLPG
jgi:hypothetical protein